MVDAKIGILFSVLAGGNLGFGIWELTGNVEASMAIGVSLMTSLLLVDLATDG